MVDVAAYYLVTWLLGSCHSRLPENDGLINQSNEEVIEEDKLKCILYGSLQKMDSERRSLECQMGIIV